MRCRRWDFVPFYAKQRRSRISPTAPLLGAAGISYSIYGERIIPIGTLYDPFIARGVDALNYACYMDSSFLLVATPSGVTLLPEGGAHQSIGTPLIGISQDGVASFEPAFLDELSIIMDWAFDYLQREAVRIRVSSFVNTASGTVKAGAR